jgi:SAM-dependent methyltransferase
MSEAPQLTPMEQAWDEAAVGYDAYFGPRFAPYLAAAIGALLARSSELPNGGIVVPCAGPGRELGPLARALPQRSILASDLSREMVRLAADRNAQLPNVSVQRADATALLAPPGGAAALLSVFGLQLLPAPASTLGSWLQLLAPGGLAVIVYWPRNTEDSGPFHSMQRILRHVGLRAVDWEAELVPQLNEAGGQLLVDARLGFAMQHDSAHAIWDAYTHSGPLRALALTRGQALIDSLAAEFVADLPAGPLEHTPEARLLVIARG